MTTIKKQFIYEAQEENFNVNSSMQFDLEMKPPTGYEGHTYTVNDYINSIKQRTL